MLNYIKYFQNTSILYIFAYPNLRTTIINVKKMLKEILFIWDRSPVGFIFCCLIILFWFILMIGMARTLSEYKANKKS